MYRFALTFVVGVIVSSNFFRYALSLHYTHWGMLIKNLAWTQVFENPDALLRKFDLEAVLQKLRDSMRQQYPLVRDVFRP